MSIFIAAKTAAVTAGAFLKEAVWTVGPALAITGGFVGMLKMFEKKPTKWEQAVEIADQVTKVSGAMNVGFTFLGKGLDYLDGSSQAAKVTAAAVAAREARKAEYEDKLLQRQIAKLDREMAAEEAAAARAATVTAAAEAPEVDVNPASVHAFDPKAPKPKAQRKTT